MAEATITVYGADWCPDCRRSKKFLQENSIPFKWVDTEADKAAEDFVRHLNNGRRVIPTIMFKDGTILTEPSDEELATKIGLGIKTL